MRLLGSVMKRFALLLCCLLTGCAIGPKPVSYRGADAGALVLSLGQAPGTYYNSYTLLVGSKGGMDRQSISFTPSDMLGRGIHDYADSDTGIVEVRNLAPGDYEIFDFQIYYNNGAVSEDWSSKTAVSLPFHIATGQATYIGNFMAVGLRGKNLLGLPVPAGAYFVVSDKGARDI
jgi:hypothetical protein